MMPNTRPTLEDLKQSKPTDLVLEPQDPETAARIAAFLKAKGGEAGAEPVPTPQPGQPAPEGEEAAPAKERINIPPNPEFEYPDPNQQFIANSMVPLGQVKVTDEDKETYLRAVLNDEPFVLNVSLYGGRLKVAIRSRSTYEQKRVFDILKKDQDDGICPPDDPSVTITRMHQYLALLMVQRVNGVLWSELELQPGKSLTEHAELMRAAVTEKFETVGKQRQHGNQQVNSTSIFNACRIFEHKCGVLSTEAANDDFWRPQG